MLEVDLRGIKGIPRHMAEADSCGVVASASKIPCVNQKTLGEHGINRAPCLKPTTNLSKKFRGYGFLALLELITVIIFLSFNITIVIFLVNIGIDVTGLVAGLVAVGFLGAGAAHSFCCIVCQVNPFQRVFSLAWNTAFRPMPL
jgi:hypothetical protein